MFDKRIGESKFLTPPNFEPEVQQIEYRKDMLTGIWCRINVKRTGRVKQAQSELDYSELIQKSIKKCFFCPVNVEKTTPKFSPEIAPEGRLRLGEAAVFPNLFPFAKHHAVATLSKNHFLSLHEFTKTQIENVLRLSLEYFKRVYKVDKTARYGYFNWNHLPPSGASIVHPHAQLTVDERPTQLNDLYLKRSAEYYKKHKRNYWLAIAKEEEKRKERWIGRTDNIAWFASFAPLGNNEITTVFEDACSLLDIQSEISIFAAGIRKILDGYSALGIKSFNLTFYPATFGEKRKDFRLNARLISRPSPQRYYTSDTGFMETLHHERVVENMPEKLAEEIRKFF